MPPTIPSSDHASKRRRRATLALTVCLLVIALTPTFAQTPPEPKPDPAGVVTGDKSSVVDAVGNSFVVTEPTDKTAPDYAQKKKDFDEYQSQVAKEPLAGKLADSVGHIRLALVLVEVFLLLGVV